MTIRQKISYLEERREKLKRTIASVTNEPDGYDKTEQMRQQMNELTSEIQRLCGL
jgi:hypothetical protein